MYQLISFCIVVIVTISSCKTKPSTPYENKPNTVQVQEPIKDTCLNVKDSIYKLIYIDHQHRTCTSYRLDSLIPLYKDCILQMDSNEIGRKFLKYIDLSMQQLAGSTQYTRTISPRIPIYKNGKTYRHPIYNNTRGSYSIVVDFDPITRKPIDVRVSFGNGGATPTD